MSESADNRSMRKGLIMAGVAALVVVAGGIATRVHSERQLAGWTAAQSVPTVGVIHPVAVSNGGALTLPASLQAINSAPIYARTNGYVRRWYVDIGQPVNAGQLLAVIDAPEVDQQLLAARADLQTALANQQLAATTATRWSTMLAKDAVSKQEADEKAGDLAAKTAVSNAARANVARLGALQGFTRLTAPFGGVVTTRSIDIGTLVSTGTAAAQPLFTVADVRRMRIFVKVPQAYSAQVHPSMTVTLTLPEYPGRSFTATMTHSAGAVDSGSGTVLVELEADNGDHALKPGAYAQASFPLATGTGLSLPSSALIVGKAGTQVAVLGADGKAQLRTITIGRDLGEKVEISAGLSPTDRVIDSPPDSLQSGDPVKVRQ